MVERWTCGAGFGFSGPPSAGSSRETQVTPGRGQRRDRDLVYNEENGIALPREGTTFN